MVSSLNVSFLINSASWKSFQVNLFKYNSLLCGIVLYTHYNLGSHFFIAGLYFISLKYKHTHVIFIMSLFSRAFITIN